MLLSESNQMMDLFSDVSDLVRPMSCELPCAKITYSWLQWLKNWWRKCAYHRKSISYQAEYAPFCTPYPRTIQGAACCHSIHRTLVRDVLGWQMLEMSAFQVLSCADRFWRLSSRFLCKKYDLVCPWFAVRRADRKSSPKSLSTAERQFT
jgi:hypothetical protein